MMQSPANYAIFPVINATLNGTSAALLVVGHGFIQRGRMAAHRAVMLTAVVTSSLFLTSYLYYHFHVGAPASSEASATSAFCVSIAFLICYLTYHAQVGSVHYPKTGVIRLVYFTILISHTILAVAIVPLVIITLTRALRERYDRHRAIARWTYPLWLYVSVTGVVIYFMLYHLFPA